jgi:L-ornithine N5-oxygenase
MIAENLFSDLNENIKTKPFLPQQLLTPRSEYEGDQSVIDLVVVGFGPASLALAIMLDSYLTKNNLRVLFLEKQSEFAWHPNLLIEGTYVQNHFLKDLVTQVNPTSQFTFINYLHEKGRLWKFINLNLTYISRHEFSDYMKWAATHFAQWVKYSCIVQTINPVPSSDQTVHKMQVEYQHNGSKKEIYARNVVYAMGQEPHIPDIFREVFGKRVFHALDFNLRFKEICKNAPNQRLVIVGNGQSAAQIFNFLLDQYPGGQVTNIMRSFGYKPADDSPYMNEVFNPEFVDYFYSLPPDKRDQTLVNLRPTNNGVVQGELIAETYNKLYQRTVINQPGFNIRGYTSVTRAKLMSNGVCLTVEEVNTGVVEQIECDYVILSTGCRYQDMLNKSLSPIKEYLLKDDLGGVQITRDYQIVTDFRMKAGLYALGYAENSHGLTETLLSLLPVRAKNLLDSLVARLSVYGTSINE